MKNKIAKQSRSKHHACVNSAGLPFKNTLTSGVLFAVGAGGANRLMRRNARTLAGRGTKRKIRG
jgi:hypothetical protein